MKTEISTHYFINKYSYILFLLLSFLLYKLLSNIGEISFFILIESFLTVAYIIWIFSLGSYHFFSQTQVSKVDEKSLCLRKMLKTYIINDNDVDTVLFLPIVYTKGRKLTIKIKLVIYTKEEFFFQIKIDKELIDISRIQDSKYFYEITNKFWNSVDNSKIKSADSIFLV